MFLFGLFSEDGRMKILYIIFGKPKGNEKTYNPALIVGLSRRGEGYF